MDAEPLRFIGEPIEVVFDLPPVHSKTPPCPDGFTWGQQCFRIVEKIGEWHDFRRRGRMAANMSPPHAAVAASRGSWGVGRFYFRVLTDTGQLYDIYYDRAPKDAGDRSGAWFL
ncbi:MAG: hypothetical protein JXA42_02125, partial [Anaerolineales bacterium]|nr:hypothetical protein [Anaerolineales bacterium]